MLCRKNKKSVRLQKGSKVTFSVERKKIASICALDDRFQMDA